jgi:hypothetical protein
MQRINLNDVRIHAVCFTANAINLGTIRAELQRTQYKYTLVYVVAALLNKAVYNITHASKTSSLTHSVLRMGINFCADN